MVQIVAALLLLAAEPATPVTETAPEVKPAEAQAGAPAPPGAEGAPAQSVAQPSADPSAAAVAAAPVTPPVAPDDGAPRRFTASLGLGRAYPGGEAVADSPMNDLTSPMGQLTLWLGFRITPRWLAGLYLDGAGGGTPGALLRGLCTLDGEECITSSTQVGIEGRYVFEPAARQTWWAGAGLGTETTGTSLKGSNADRSYLGSYSGGVFPRLSGGWDRRVSRIWGWGFYGTLSFGRYSKLATGGGDPRDIPGDTAGHSWLGLGARIILFP